MRTYYANAIEVLAFVPDVPVVLAATKCDDTTRRGDESSGRRDTERPASAHTIAPTRHSSVQCIRMQMGAFSSLRPHNPTDPGDDSGQLLGGAGRGVSLGGDVGIVPCCAEVDPDEGQALADSLGWQFFEVSARQNINVDAAFEAVLSQVGTTTTTSSSQPTSP